MSYRKLIVSTALVVLPVVCGLALAQQPAPVPDLPAPRTAPPQPVIPAPSPAPHSQIPPAPAVSIPVAQVAPRPEDLTIDQLLDTVDQIRTQKAELDKREQEVLKVLRRKAEKQKERMDKLGVDGPLPVAPTATTSQAEPQIPALPPVSVSVAPPVK